MSMMIDKTLRNKITVDDVKEGATQILFKVANENVRACSIDLRIGDIYRPGSKAQHPGSAARPRKRYSLLEGETAVVRTLEVFKLSSKHAAVVLPVGGVSRHGLLMTNPGHVDPGYQGELHVTVINMAREPFLLKSGDRLLRALLFELSDAVEKPYSESAAPVDDELLESLAPDFLSVTARGAAAAKREIDKAVRTNAALQYVVPALVAGVVGLASAWLTSSSLNSSFENRVGMLEEQTKRADADIRLRKLENDFPTERRLQSIENKLELVMKATQK